MWSSCSVSYHSNHLTVAPLIDLVNSEINLPVVQLAHQVDLVSNHGLDFLALVVGPAKHLDLLHRHQRSAQNVATLTRLNTKLYQHISR